MITYQRLRFGIMQCALALLLLVGWSDPPRLSLGHDALEPTPSPLQYVTYTQTHEAASEKGVYPGSRNVHAGRFGNVELIGSGDTKRNHKFSSLKLE